MKKIILFPSFLILTITTILHSQEIFEPAVEIFAGYSLPTVNAWPHFADFNGDGLMDLGLNPSPPFGSSTHGWFNIHLNDGQNYFGDPDQSITELLTIDLNRYGFADITGDNRADILVGGHYLSNSNLGDDYFISEYASEHNLSYVHHGDINGDELIDIIVYSSGEEIVYVAYNDGAGGFNAIDELTDSYYYGLADPKPIIKDFNNDGLMDIVLYPSYSDQAPFFFMQEMDGSFSSVLLPITKADMNNKMGGTDLDGDGDLEFIYENDGYHIAIINEEGTFTTLDTLNSIGGRFYDFDLNGVAELLHDGNKLLLSSYDSGTHSYNMNGAEILSSTEINGIPYVIDFDFDGDLDILFIRINSSFKYPIYLLKNKTVVASQENLWPSQAHSIFPNPTQGEINIQINVEQINIANFVIFDLMGHEVFQVNTTSGSNKIELPKNMASGLYYYQIKDKNNHILAIGSFVKSE